MDSSLAQGLVFVDAPANRGVVVRRSSLSFFRSRIDRGLLA